MAKFFVNPFAISGTRVPIPEGVQPSGEVSYTTGFTVDYSLDQLTNPNAKNVPRDKTNELYYEITLALQQYQTKGSPAFITTADNLGVPYPYTYNAIVNYDDGFNGVRLYRSLVNNNATLPSVSTSWQMLPFFINGTVTGTANALTLHTSSAYQTFIFGDEAQLQIATTNTGPATLKIGSGPAVAIRKVLNGLVPLFGNEMKAGGIYDFVYDGTFWVLKNPTENTVLYSLVSFQAASAQTIPAGTNQKVLFDNVISDSHGWWDSINHRFIPTIPGKFRISQSVVSLLNTASATGECVMYVRKNGTNIAFMTAWYESGPLQAFGFATVSPILIANGTTDYFELFFNNERLGSVTLGFFGFTSTGLSSTFEIEYIGQ